jgi:hypothetical protein
MEVEMLASVEIAPTLTCASEQGKGLWGQSVLMPFKRLKETLFLLMKLRSCV